MVIGKQGQVALALRATQPQNIKTDYRGRAQLDIRQPDAIHKLLRQKPFDLVINASGYTQVDLAETQHSEADALNHLSVKQLAISCAEHNIRLIHLSTDYVFDGKQDQPYRPDDVPHPINAYGQTKLAGEQALTRYHPKNSTIIRSAWLYSPFGNNFVKTMLKLMNSRSEINVIADQQGSPTSAIELAQFIWQISLQDTTSPRYHWSDIGVTSWFEFAKQIQTCAIEEGLLNKEVNIKPISSQDYNAAATRPQFSALDCQHSYCLRQAKRWQTNLKDVMKTIKNNEET
nr:dTDP-4-dehydrorhamnose reductase [Shewanella sp. Isolate11]